METHSNNQDSYC